MLRLKLAGLISVVAIAFLLTGCSKSEPSNAASTTPSTVIEGQHGTITIEANISSGTHFGLYYNNNWSRPPALLPLVTGSWSTYQFDVVAPLIMFRMDFSESPDAVAIIRKIRISMPGDKPRLMNLEDLTKWSLSKCTVTYNAQDGTATIRANGVADLMYGVDVSKMRAE